MRKIMRINKGVLILLALFLGIALLYGPHMLRADGDDGISARMYWQQKFQYYSGTASEAITMGQTLSINAKDGTITKADADSASGVSNTLIGLAGNTAAKGGSVQVVTHGILSGIAVPAGNNTGITPYGTPIFLSTVAGGLTVYNSSNAWVSGDSRYVGTALARSDYAVKAGVTAGTDTMLVNVFAPAGVSPFHF